MRVEDEWATCSDPAVLMSITRRQKHRYRRGTRGRRLRLLACAYMRLGWDRLTHESVRAAIIVAEEFADRKRSTKDLLEADREVSKTQFAFPCNYRDACYTLLEPSNEVAATVPSLIGLRDNRAYLPALIRDIFGNPFRPVAFDPAWRTSTAVALAQQMYGSRDFGIMPILGDALQDAGCENAEVLDHCRGPGPHVRGCWVVDLVLGKS